MVKGDVQRREIIRQLAECFRQYGFEGASLKVISDKTGLGKGSLYNLFPGGKDEMADAVLADIENWFDSHIFKPLQTDDPVSSIEIMLERVEDYFLSGEKICLVGAFSLDATRDKFADTIGHYFTQWTLALQQALQKKGLDQQLAGQKAMDIIAMIQGGIILARSLDNPTVFHQMISRLKECLSV